VSAPFDEFVFPEPWWDLRGNGLREGEQRERLVRRLRTETGDGHPLSTRLVEALAAFTRQDEVLYRLDGGQEFLFAHLTYTSNPPDPYIGLRLFSSWNETAAMVDEMAEMW
jgi:hypothetical protein